MNLTQLNQLGVAIAALNYPIDVFPNIMGDSSFHIIKCKQELIPTEVCKLLVDAPDFNGIMTWNVPNTEHRLITFTYHSHKSNQS